MARRHEWRKREKDRYHAALLLARAWPGKRRRGLVGKLSEALGEERDAQLLIERLGAPAASADAADKGRRRALAVLARRRTKLAQRANDLGARLHELER
jgi:hypothetical protein